MCLHNPGLYYYMYTTTELHFFSTTGSDDSSLLLVLSSRVPAFRRVHGRIFFCGGRVIIPVLHYYYVAAELGRNPVSKHEIQPEYGDEQADVGRDG